MRFTDYTVKTWLTLSFGGMLALSVITSAVSLSKLVSVHESLEDVVLVNNVKTKLNQDMSESVHIVSRVIRTMALLEDKTAKEHEELKIKQARENYDKDWQALNKFKAGEAGAHVRAKIEQAAHTSRPLNNKVMELALAGNAAEATQLLMKQAGPATQAWQDAIDENLRLQETTNEREYKEANVAYESAYRLLIGISVVSAVLAALMGWFITRGLTRALGGEPGDAADLARSVADGDLSVPIPLQHGDTASMMAQLKAMQEKLGQVVASVRSSSESVSTASAEIAQGNHDLSARTEQQASALEQTAASMEELASTVKQNADNARQANQLAQSASTVAAKGGDVVNQVVETMKGINDSSKRISDIISVIDSIAFQTNILALNAAVEAARAGEQGRGFAVVATEVRSLAGRSADAAKEIKTLINASVERVEHGTVLVDQAGETMTEVVASIRRVTDIMGEISAASAEQSQGVAQIGEAVQQMDQVTQQNAALVEEMAAAASSLKGQAGDLVQTVGVFKLEAGLNAASQPVPAPVAKEVSAAASQPVKTPARAMPRVPAIRAGGAPRLAVASAAGGSGDWSSF